MDIGIYFKDFFDNKDYFDLITKQHKFQSLTESNKETKAFRKGLYLTQVTKNNNQVHFKLLRCSTNLDGPTVNFANVDKEIINKVNNVRNKYFPDSSELNHVLAQIYYNHENIDGKEKKAKIKKHSDKTKDMPLKGMLAFCTFYKFNPNVKHIDKNYMYKGKTSVLTKLVFRLKDCVDNKDNKYKNKFEILLEPNSLYLLPLEMNQIYTHEISPSSLPVNLIPTRLGYVIRCSNTDAVHKDNKTYIIKNNEYIELEQPTELKIADLKGLYRIENLTTTRPNYNNFYFSLNEGDYKCPTL